MPLIFNGTTIKAVTYNGTTLDKVIYNGTTVWERWAAITATGGSVAVVGDYKIHTFTSNGSFVVSNAGYGATTVDYLIVGGGGGGGTADSVGKGGGGGAGGLLYGSLNVTAQTYSIAIGGGGSGGNTGADTRGNNGGNSSALGLTALGGGGGGGGKNATYKNGKSGGSGGGSGEVYGYGSGGSGTSGQGYAGAVGGGSIGEGGAGGSKTGVGSLRVPASAYTSSISGSSKSYARGGYGQYRDENPNQSGAANTGNGGSGNYSIKGATGGSGIVIIRYRIQP